MQIIVRDAKDDTIYTKYSLPNLDFVHGIDDGNGNVIVEVTKGATFPTQQEFIDAGMK